MNITIFGSGYVGLVTAACFAEVGNDVACIDIDEQRIANLNRGKNPIHEAGLDELISNNLRKKRLRFSTDAKQGVDHATLQLVAVGTPPSDDGAANLDSLMTVADTIAERATNTKIVVCKSTVPVGTADRVKQRLQTILDKRNAGFSCEVVSNPEFLKEGSAVNDFMKPDRIVVGTDSEQAKRLLHELYEPFNRNHDRTLFMDIRSAELTKYAANAMLATKISFINEMAALTEELGADIEQVRIGIGADPRIGYHFIYPGPGFGGSCFPKDLKALIHTAEAAGCELSVVRAVNKANQRQKQLLFIKLCRYFDGEEKLNGLTIAVWGLAFKAGTDDMRESPSRDLLEALWSAGAKVRAYDPAANEVAQQLYPDQTGLTLCDNAYDALTGADALCVVTEWKEFRSPDFDKIKTLLKHPVIIDGRNLYEPAHIAELGIDYFAIGRQALSNQDKSSGKLKMVSV
ncbi:MAG: UDP-glucose/GDP-mannose dehydrogenase family protein [Gammaproteobacteria bacterium]|nr:UDP-glucose/GDP-mannose dehydrogenase family protein [Gammaproteobacteria bacterium]